MHSLESLGWDLFFDRQLTEEERLVKRPARVTRDGRERYRLSTGDAEWLGELAGRFRHEVTAAADFPVVGDWVVVTTRAGGTATIHRRLLRRTQFSRGAAGPAIGEQVVAANVDTVWIVSSFNNDLNLRRLERYLTLVVESGAAPVIVLNKVDLVDRQEQALSELALIAPDVPVHVASAIRGDGLDGLRALVRTGGTTTLLGSSGVGKSSLLNAVIGDARQPVLPTREHDDRGRHSTTAGQLFGIPEGGLLIDTPGMRELQLWDADEGIEQTFGDIVTLSRSCRFRDCVHEREPGCAVLAAVDAGSLPADRLDSYRRLQRENAFLLSRLDPSIRAERTRKWKQIAKSARRHTKFRGR